MPAGARWPGGASGHRGLVRARPRPLLALLLARGALLCRPAGGVSEEGINCKRGYFATWSKEKVRYCCAVEQIGCNVPTTVTTTSVTTTTRTTTSTTQTVTRSTTTSTTQTSTTSTTTDRTTTEAPMLLGYSGDASAEAAAQARPTLPPAHAPGKATAADEEATPVGERVTDCHVEGKVLLESMRFPGRYLKVLGPNSGLVISPGPPEDDLWQFRTTDLSDGKAAIESVRFKGFYIDAYGQAFLQSTIGVRLTRGDPEDGSDWARFVFRSESSDSKDVVEVESARFPGHFLDAQDKLVNGGFQVGLTYTEHPSESSWAMFRLHSVKVGKGSACGKMATRTTTRAPLPGMDPYDCLDGREQHESGRGVWSKDKQKWCCQHRALGCGLLELRHSTTSTTTTLTASDSVSSTTGSTSTRNTTDRGTRGAPDEPQLGEGLLGAAPDSQIEVDAPATHTHLTRSKGSLSDGPFDCKVGWALMPQWSYDKKSWCCEHEQIACQPSQASDPYDCAAGYDSWEDGWSENKREWCCRNHHRGCVEQAPERNRSDNRKGEGKKELTFNCSVGISIVGQWAFEKKEYCCTHHQIGCYPTVVSDPFDCTVGWAAWEDGWSENKKDWCCANHHRGCSNTTSEPFDCTSSGGYAHWEVGWSDMKKNWCCENKNRGCQTTSTTTPTGPTEAPFDCVVTHAGNELGNWSIKQRQWCCLIQGKECPTTTTAPFNCDEGQPDPHTAWSQHTKGEHWTRYKRNWCCLNERKGCPEGGETSYDCDKGNVTTWSLRKRSWCCQNEDKGCPKPYNCEEGVPRGTGGDWSRGWSLSKQSWCCQHEQLGCFDSSGPSFAVLHGKLSVDIPGAEREQVEDIVKSALAKTFAVPQSALIVASELAARRLAASTSTCKASKVGFHVKSDSHTVARVHKKVTALHDDPSELSGCGRHAATIFRPCEVGVRTMSRPTSL
ncbi:unnamed protein product [Prorocentrum cordatum]|uniref:Uncharacterized protein n=1 Tax=Prorocentrum cordatum TaxID=2364126 RepID=A0ABN9RTF4_9DINO|nr:unnamed protein product [Polarella glacialis]